MISYVSMTPLSLFSPSRSRFGEARATSPLKGRKYSILRKIKLKH
jgi:hypothetical protein